MTTLRIFTCLNIVWLPPVITAVWFFIIIDCVDYFIDFYLRIVIKSIYIHRAHFTEIGITKCFCLKYNNTIDYLHV